MIKKFYEVSCDFCGRAIKHYNGRKPTREQLENDGAVCTTTKQFCSNSCYQNHTHDHWNHVFANLKNNHK